MMRQQAQCLLPHYYMRAANIEESIRIAIRHYDATRQPAERRQVLQLMLMDFTLRHVEALPSCRFATI